MGSEVGDLFYLHSPTPSHPTHTRPPHFLVCKVRGLSKVVPKLRSEASDGSDGHLSPTSAASTYGSGRAGNTVGAGGVPHADAWNMSPQ